MKLSAPPSLEPRIWRSPAIRRPPGGHANFGSRRQCGRRRCRHRPLYQRAGNEMTGFAGVAPAMLRMAADGEVRNFVGVGPWPKNLDAAYFREHHDGLVPPGILETVVPAAPDIWLTALQKLGTLSFGKVAEAAICLARDGFPMYPFMMQSHFDDFKDCRGRRKYIRRAGRCRNPGTSLCRRTSGARPSSLWTRRRPQAVAGGIRLHDLSGSKERHPTRWRRPTTQCLRHRPLEHGDTKEDQNVLRQC